MHDVPAICGHFRIPGAYLESEIHGNGHINDTYAARFDPGGGLPPRRFIVQRVNHEVFTDPVGMMENIERVTAHLRSKLAPLGAAEVSRRTLSLVHNRDGSPFYRDPAGNYWRCYDFIENTTFFNEIQSPRQAREIARAFGGFLVQVDDLDGPRLNDTIPLFHHTPKRFRDFVQALEDDPLERAAGARPEIDFALSQEPLTRVLLDLHEAGEIPERVTHNDTKVNNILLDDATYEAICVIDLDTIMPGLALYDFGDMVRTATCGVPEDETDLAKVTARLPFFEALVEGYLGAAGDILTPAEIDHLPFSGLLITFQIGLRFLTDHLLGDGYFRIHYPNHNLDRARAQFALARDIAGKQAPMAAVVERYGGRGAR